MPKYVKPVLFSHHFAVFLAKIQFSIRLTHTSKDMNRFSSLEYIELFHVPQWDGFAKPSQIDQIASRLGRECEPAMLHANLR